LRSRGGRWTREALARFLDDPQHFAPGTTMPDPRIEDPEVRDAVIHLLERMEHSF
jgi:cytochrome c2